MIKILLIPTAVSDKFVFRLIFFTENESINIEINFADSVELGSRPMKIIIVPSLFAGRTSEQNLASLSAQEATITFSAGKSKDEIKLNLESEIISGRSITCTMSVVDFRKITDAK